MGIIIVAQHKFKLALYWILFPAIKIILVNRNALVVSLLRSIATFDTDSINLETYHLHHCVAR